MEEWEIIKKQIKRETNRYFENKEIDIDNLIDLLKKTFNAPIEPEYTLNGVASNYTNALFTVLNDDSTKKERIANFGILKNVEPVLKKILYFINPDDFHEIKNQQKGLVPILKKTNLNPNNIYCDKNHLQQYSYKDFEYHLIRTYLLRNLESHNAEDWTSRELEENIETLLIFYLETINFNKGKLGTKLSEIKYDFVEYINSEINNFEVWSSRFIATDIVEDATVFESYAIENLNVYTEEDDKKEREGTVDFIRKKYLPEKRMLLWGDAGLGKSTTLQYLTYMDAKEYKQGTSNIIPIYLPLGLLIEKNISLEVAIFDKINVSLEDGRKFLKEGKISLFLDGVNEIPDANNSDISTIRIKEIQGLIDKYPNTLIIISNRPEKYNQLSNIPVFRLQPMSYEQIINFIDRNVTHANTKTIVKNAIINNKRLLNIISTPLMTTRLISIVQEFKYVPSNEGKIIKLFLDTLYKREKVEKKDARFEEDKINFLLISLAVYGFKKNGTNSGLTRLEVLSCFSKCLEQYHFEYDTVYALEILIKMGVLNSNQMGDIIVFSHQAYQDYYVSQSDSYSLLSEREIKKISEELTNNKQTPTEDVNKISDDDILELIANEPKYEKSIIYKTQTSSNNDIEDNIKKLANINILLAVKTFITSEYSEITENYLLILIKEKFYSTTDEELKTSCFISLLYLDKLDEVFSLLNDMMFDENLNKENILAMLVNKLDEKNNIKFLLQLIKIFNIHKIKDFKKCIKMYFNLTRRRNLEFVWKKEDNEIIKKIIVVLKSIYRMHYSYLNIFFVYNIPKEYIFKEDYDFANSLLGGAHSSIGEKFLHKYTNNVSVSTHTKLDNLCIQKHRINFIHQMSKQIKQIIIDDDIEDFIYFFRKDSTIRAYVFTLFDKSLKTQIYNDYGFYYYFDNYDSNILTRKSNLNEIIKIISIIRDNNMFELYSTPCEVINKLCVTTDIDDIENIANSSCKKLSENNNLNLIKEIHTEIEKSMLSEDINFNLIKEAIISTRVEKNGYVLVSLLKFTLEKKLNRKLTIKMKKIINQYQEYLDVISNPYSVKLRSGL